MPISASQTRASFARTTVTIALSVLAAAVIVACQPAVTPANAQGTQAAASVPAVAVAAVQQRSIAPQFAQVGRVEAAQRVEIRARVAGHIEAVLFREGDIVRAGQPLFRIDSRPFDVALDRARAELQLARAKESLARSEAERAQRLSKDSAISTEELERRVAAHAEAAARAAAAQAQLQSAALDREFSVITAPTTGRIGRALVTNGNFVAAGGSQTLATIASVAPLHVYFDVGDPALVAQLAADRKQAWTAQVMDPQAGALIAVAPVDFVDNEMAGTTGTLRLRARIDKPAGIVPGQFVRVQLAGTAGQAVLVPDKAVGSDQGQPFVLVVTPQQLAEYRPVKLGAAHGDLRVIASGVRAGEQVVASGLMKVRPGTKVQPLPADAAQAQAPTASKS
ncbi:MAG: efflux RND transporter periplasmic adaptor subunit [Ramlibacter sp.]